MQTSQQRLPETYDDLKDRFSTVWANQINHPWKKELSLLEESFWNSLQLYHDYIKWTPDLIATYLRMKNILRSLQKRYPHHTRH
jgi:hypothetical protein